MLNTQFFKKFAKPELKSIAGKRYSNLLVLSTILILSMLAIGLGKGSISYLDKKMNNPFVSYVNVKIPMGNPIQIPDMEGIYNKTRKKAVQANMIINNYENKDAENLTNKDSIEYENSLAEYKSCLNTLGVEKMDLDSISFYDFYGFKAPYAVYDKYVNFTNKEKDISKNALVRKGHENDSVYEFILKNDKLTLNNSFDFDGWGCVVSLDFLKNKYKLNYDVYNIPFLNYSKQVNGEYCSFSIPVQGIVESFPHGVDMLVGKKLFNAFEDGYNFWSSLIILDSNRTSYLQYYVDNDQNLEDYLIENNFKEIEYDYIMYDNGKMYKKDKLTIEERNVILNDLPSLNTSYNVFDFNLVNLPRNMDVEREYFIFKFDKLDNIAIFNSFLKENTVNDNKTLKIDMSVIKSKNNFDLFNKLANLLSVALIAFCIFCLWLYITNLIVSHISKNKKNLGTLKAFGLSNNNIILIYSAISITLISISFVISFLVSKLIGPVIVPLVANYSEIGDASSLNYISYPIYILAAFFIVLPSIAIYLKLWWELRKSTPGDLIYGRE